MGEIQDGSAVFQVLDKRKEKLRQEFVDLVYPVGIVVAIANDNKPDFMNYGKWEKVAPGRTLWGADSSHTAGSTIEAGLPNITAIGITSSSTSNNISSCSGAIYWDKNKTLTSGKSMIFSRTADSNGRAPDRFDASRSNSIYGKSSTVQPPAYVVTYWQRTE